MNKLVFVDRWGRRVAVSCSAAGLMLGALKTLTGGYSLYLVLELLEASVVGAIYTTAFVLGNVSTFLLLSY